MYAGQIFETNAAKRLNRDPLHPYTAALAAARPDIAASAQRLAAIPGHPVSAFEAPAGCAFAPRCVLAQDACRTARPPLESLGGGEVRCRRARELCGRVVAAMSGESEVSHA
jgi:oligopeptide/dipeptide ABC transporter ATP-binding protein